MSRVPASQAGKIAKLWDFKCLTCEHTFEAMAKQDDIESNLVECPQCHGFLVKKLITIGCVDSHAAASWRH